MKKKTPFLLKQIERAAYLFLLFSLAIGRLVTIFFITFPFLLKRQNPKKDFLFFPYAHKDNIGTISRFQLFLPLLEKDGYHYDIFYIWDKKTEEKIYYKSNSRTKEYLHLAGLFWRRLFQAIQSGKYRAVFFQRGLFPDYYNQYTPYIEKLVCKINNNVTVDFFDADYARNEKLINSIAEICNKVAVVNQHLAAYFAPINSAIFLNDLAVNLRSYKIKTDYTFKTPINIFWTGSPENAENLKDIIPVLERINKTYPLKLTMVCRNNAGYNSSVIQLISWDIKTFFDKLYDADIAIYPAMEETEYTRGKVAYKSIEYGAAALPMVASKFGLSPHFENEQDVLIAADINEWETQLLRLINDKELRNKIGKNARLKTQRFHSLESTYKKFLEILIEENPNPVKK